jgi:hypothetical protein
LLYRRRQSYEERAKTLTKNIASAVDQNISRTKIDFALRTVADELERQLAGKGIDESAMNAFLARQEQRLPETEAFLVAQADGQVILGKRVNKLDRANWVGRDHFTFLREQLAVPKGATRNGKVVTSWAAIFKLKGSFRFRGFAVNGRFRFSPPAVVGRQ